MLLQELFMPENAQLKNAYSITLDKASSDVAYSTPPENLEEIGFVFTLGEDNTMSEDLLDIVISYKLTNLPVLMEIPSQLVAKGEVSVKYLLNLASNVDFSIALLPPGHPLVGNELTVEQYKQIVWDTVDEMLKKPNFDKFIYPVSNFFEYLMLEKILGQEKLVNFRPEHKYVQDNFANLMTVQDSDALKAGIRQKLYDFYGGQAGFDMVATAIFEGLYDKSKELYKSQVQSYVQQSQASMTP